MMTETIGYIIGGGLKEGFQVRLTVPAQEVQEGSFVVCDSGPWRFFGLVTDLRLGATDPRFAEEQSQHLQPAIGRLLLGKTLYTTLEVYPTLMMDRGPDPDEDPSGHLDWQEQVDSGKIGPQPVKTIPPHHTAMRLARNEDVDLIFPGDFVIGHTLEQEYAVRLNLQRLVKRSSGIFGATGTGKSFLTRIVLAGLMKEDVAGALVFDMHNEYAYDVPDSDQESGSVRGLKSLFGPKVQVATLGKGQMVRGHSPDFDLELAMSDFETSDIMLLSQVLNLTDTAAVTLNALEKAYGHNWFARFMELRPGATEYDPEQDKRVPAQDSVEVWARGHNVHPAAAEALHRKLKRIHDKDYVTEKPAADAVSAIVDKLEHGRHVVLSFGRYDRDEDYLLVSNVLTRRIRQKWVEKTESHLADEAPPPRPLVIAIEEAHKLLNPRISAHTPFGIIARELRKYNVTLLVVDQRPSGIDDEVMSQLGTRITGWLGDEDDIRAVLSGLAGREQLRGMLARLREKEEVLLLGWGVKMPIPVRSRRYDQEFWEEMRGKKKRKSGGDRRGLESIDDIDDVIDRGNKALGFD